MKKQLLLLVTMLLPMMASAYDIAVKNADGVTIYYNYVNNATELEVTNDGYKSYSGSVDIPEEVTYMNRTRKVTSIGAETFSFCSELTSVTIPYGVINFGKKAFEYCRTLAYITIPNSVTNIGEESFSYCSSLTSIEIPNSVTSIGSRAFYQCSRLTSITIGNGVSKIENQTFSRCDKLTSITIPSTVTSIGSSAFSGCSSLTYITIPNTVTSIGNGAFEYCSTLTYVTIPNTVNKIDDNVFKDCSSLISIKIPDSVTSIGNWAFQNCSNLKYVSIPRDVTYMGYMAFDGCDIPTIISKIENPSSIGTQTFSVNTFYNATLYVPKGTGYKYKNTQGWQQFHFIDDNGGGDNELINYPVSIDGINLFASDNTQVSFSTILINNNSKEVNCIRFGKSYKYTDNEYFYVKLSVAGGFKVGDVIEIAGAYNNQDTKNSAISFRIDPTSSSPIWTTDNFINGRYSSEEPRIQTYTLTTNADVLYFGRSGNTGTGITYLKVKRDQEVLPTDIAINETNFPDANFRNYLLSQSFGSDGVITEAEIAGVKEIDVSNHNITSLEGIEFFTALTTLWCYENQLTTLDVTKNIMLKELGCYINQLTMLDVSNNTALKYLDCGNNQLTTLDVSKNTALLNLYCYDNQLTTLDVSKNTVLRQLYCSQNQLTTLDVSKNTALQAFWCEYNQLTTLDISKNTMLTQLLCGNNQLTTLDVSKNTALLNLYCYDNQLTTLDVSKNTALQNLSCYNNQLTTLDVSKNTALLNLYCGNNQLTTLDVSKNTALLNLYCYDNQLTTLDVSKNTALLNLYCYDNQLTTLDVSKNTALQNLSCYNNQLTTLDISKNTMLTQLLCYNNQLTTLDVTKNTMLITLWCDNNLLTTLDVTKNTKLTSLSCYKNQIKGAEMDALVESLPKQESAEFYVYVRSVSEGNVCTTEQVNIAKQKGWKVLYYNQDKKEWEEYAGSEPIDNSIAINESNFPDANFRNYLLSQSFGSDGVITEAEIAGVKEIDVSNHNITSLEGIEFFTALEKLYCEENLLTVLDVSKNTALFSLDCWTNRLTSIDVSKNIALQNLVCYNNQLTTLDVLKNTALKYLDCGNNQLTTLDISKNTMLTQLGCYNNQLTTLDVSKNTALQIFSCDYNQLKDLDISKNTMLTQLGCDNNQLITLDVSKNTKLEKLYCAQNKLTTLDVSNHKDLWQFYCSKNQLTTLNISKDVPLVFFECYQNQIKGTAMDALVENLTISKTSMQAMRVIYNEDEGNEMTVEQVNKVKEKGWIPYYFDGSKWLEYLGSNPNEIVVNAVSYEVTGNKVVVKSGRNTSGNVLIPATITIDGQTYQVTGIGDGAFKGNTAITSVTISEGITRIGAEAFEGCTNLKEIIIGKDVTAIADKAFANIIPSANAPRRAGGVVLTVYCYAVNVPQTAANAFENTPIDKALLLVEDSSLSDYSNVEPWKDFGTIQGFNGGSGINAIWAGEDSNVKIYTIDGKLLDKPQKGVNIVRMSNGTIKKVVVK